MSRNKVYAIVEGQGEALRQADGAPAAVMQLARKILIALECWNLFPVEKVPPWRMSYNEFFKDDKLERVILLHKKYVDCAALLVLLDMDDDCPTEQAFKLTRRIAAMEALPFSVVVVCARREYEAWFLASLETIHDGQRYDDDPEAIRNPKGWLRKKFGYRPTVHQASYTRKLDLDLALAKSRSFRRLYHAFEEIVIANSSNQCIITPINQR